VSIYLDGSSYDQYEAELDVRRVCRSCGRKAHLEDGRCAKCSDPESVAAEVAEANHRAGLKAREAQRQRHPEWFK
jgi:predicted ATP-dependent serine protease